MRLNIAVLSKDRLDESREVKKEVLREETLYPWPLPGQWTASVSQENLQQDFLCLGDF
jgi:hypothetical protein